LRKWEFRFKQIPFIERDTTLVLNQEPGQTIDSKGMIGKWLKAVAELLKQK